MAEHYKILIAEDESLVAKDIQNMMTSMDYEVICIVFSGEAAVEKTREVNPDLILMDIGLRGAMDGITAAELIKREFQIPIIYLTAFSDEDTLQRAKKTEPYGYIIKPFEASELRTTIDMALSRYKLEMALRDNEHLLRDTIESTMDGILVVNCDGKVLHGNSRFAKMWGIPQEVFETRDDEKLLKYVLDQLLDPETFLQKVEQLYNSNDESYDLVPFKDGKVFERFSRPLLRDGKNVGRVWSFRDISDTDSKTLSLPTQEILFSNLAELSPDPILLLQNNTCTFISDSLFSLLGVKQQENLVLADIVNEKDKQKVQQRLDDLSLERKKTSVDKVDFIAEDGTLVSCNMLTKAFSYNGQHSVLVMIRKQDEEGISANRI